MSRLNYLFCNFNVIDILSVVLMSYEVRKFLEKRKTDILISPFTTCVSIMHTYTNIYQQPLTNSTFYTQLLQGYGKTYIHSYISLFIINRKQVCVSPLDHGFISYHAY